MSEWGFGQIQWLLLLPLPLIGYLYRRNTQAPWPELFPRLSVRFPLPSTLNSSEAPDQTSSHRPLAERLLMFALLLLIVALAQPLKYSGETVTEVANEPVDLVLLVDTNITMVIEDYQVDGESISRMQLTRQLLAEFVQSYSGTRIGLSLMGSPPLHWLPYTSDRTATLDAVARLRPALGGRLSDMAASLQLVSDRYLMATSSDTEGRVVLMLTDSSLQLGAISPQQAAENLASTGADLYIIAIGSTESTKDLSLKQTSDFVYEPVDLKLLSEVAQAGNGELFHAADSGSFKEALQRIEAAHRKPSAQPDKLRLSQPLYPVPLLLGALILVLALLGTHVGRPSTNHSRSAL